MPNPPLTTGAIAFVGPSHIPTLEGFTYLRITKVQGSTVTVRPTGPDDTEEQPEFDVKSSILRHRVVDIEESELWPGSYVGQPIAFVQPSGPSSDQWAYGLVTGYSMHNNAALIHVRCDAQVLRIALTSPPTVIAVDRLNYALRTGAAVNAMVLNALELLDQQNEIIVACGKSRSGIPVSVSSTLSLPFEPSERVPLIRPDNLEIVFVRRQHIVDCELDTRSSNRPDVFKDPHPGQPTSFQAQLPAISDISMPNQTNLAFSDSDEEEKTEARPSEQADANAVQLQNRTFRKRNRELDSTAHDLLLPDDDDMPAFPVRSDAHASSFRPSPVEKLVHDATTHPALLGKNPQTVIESAQQGPRTKFLATPPVLRLAFDFIFGIRGLSLMHFRRFIQELEQQSSTSSVNMTNFGRSNALQPAVPPTNIADIVSAFNTLSHFAQGFYNEIVCDFIKTGAAFVEKYSVLSQPDSTTCNMLVFWINSKLGKFRSEIIASNIQTAACIGSEFTRNDDHLLELQQAQQARHLAALESAKTPRLSYNSRPGHTRNPRPTRLSTVPHDLLSTLPKQNGKSMCMRYLSTKGCHGPAPGQCFDPNRAHFKPRALPADAKAFIDKNFLGLAPEFQDL